MYVAYICFVDHLILLRLRVSTVSQALFCMHMSFEETRALVEYLRPERITPCVVPVESTAEEVRSS